MHLRRHRDHRRSELDLCVRLERFFRQVSYTGSHVFDCEVRVRRNAVLLFAVFFILLAPRAFADAAAIQANRLPQEPTVLAALDDARQIEPYSRSWTNNWQYEIPKDQVAARLSKDLAFLSLAVKDHPDNVELLLLTGLVAHYAYNVDVSDGAEISIKMLAQAQKLAPTDVRAPWFHASLICQFSQPKAGGEEFLAIEASHPWDQLPAAFWDDYVECASVTDMPAHALRAAEHLEELHAPNSEMRSFLAKTAQNRFDSFDPKKQYEPKDVWQAAKAGDNTEFTSTMCGVRLRAHGDWEVDQIGAAMGGGCLLGFSTGPYQGTVRKLRPTILLLVKQPEGNETFQDFVKRFTKDGGFQPFAPARCPAAGCVALKGVEPGIYKGDGDGHGRIVLFERDQPEYPGLLFESPWQIPQQSGKEGMHYYAPGQIQQRIPGKLYYLVVLDTAASIEEPAVKDLDFFLQNLTAE